MYEQVNEQTEDKWVRCLLDKHQRAGGWIRMWAGLFDFIYLSLIMIVTAAITTSWMFVQSESPSDNIQYIRHYMWENEFHLYVINWLILLIVFLTVHLLYALREKRTIGMIIVDLYVYNEKAEKPNAGQFFIREMLKYILFPFYLMSFATSRRTLYDKITKTYLVK